VAERRNTHKIIVRKPEEKKSLGRPRHSWEDNIKMDLKDTEHKDKDWIHLA
jgi:hypothetical protein